MQNRGRPTFSTDRVRVFSPHSVAAAMAIFVCLMGPTRADEYTDTIGKFYDAMLVTAQQQDEYCPRPRSHTTGRCNKDFQAVYVKAAQALGFEVMYLKSRNEGSERTQQYMAAAYDRSYAEMMEMMRALKAKYYPVKANQVEDKK